jgi:hypothetical protein
MTRPYSVDLRERVLSAVHRGIGIRGAATQFREARALRARARSVPNT